MFSKILVKLIDERGVTAYQGAKATGMSNTALSRYKAGKQAPAIDQLIAIADFFDVSTDYLLGRTEKLEANRKELSAMNFKEDCKKIVERILKQVVKSGSFDSGIYTTYGGLAKELELQSENYCKVCVQYLAHNGYVAVQAADEGMLDLSVSMDAVDLLQVDKKSELPFFEEADRTLSA